MYHVLGVGYLPEEQQVEKQKWLKYHIEFDFADTVDDAITRLRIREYSCVVLCADHVDKAEMTALRSVRPVPVVIMPPEYSAEQRQAYAIFGILQYIHAAGLGNGASLDEKTLQDYFEPNRPEPKPLTIITVKDLSFCLEYRTVEIRGKEIDLTEKEFDILALLIMNQKQVFTYEAIMDSVWHEDVTFYSPKAVSTHISNLRKKLKSGPDVPEYIKSVRGIGYKFVAPE